MRRRTLFEDLIRVKWGENGSITRHKLGSVVQDDPLPTGRNDKYVWVGDHWTYGEYEYGEIQFYGWSLYGHTQHDVNTVLNVRYKGNVGVDSYDVYAFPVMIFSDAAYYNDFYLTRFMTIGKGTVNVNVIRKDPSVFPNISESHTGYSDNDDTFTEFTLYYGDYMNVSATPAEGYEFAGWYRSKYWQKFKEAFTGEDFRASQKQNSIFAASFPYYAAVFKPKQQ